jgi:signal transduction histidine kinase
LQTAVSRYTVEIREIEEMAQKATEANQFKTQFIARMGHELRTPLGAMLGMTQMLHEGIYGSLSPDQKDLTQRIINNALVLKQIFTELLDQSQIESGQLRLRIEEFSPQALTQSVHSNYLPLALKKGLSMQVKDEANLPETVLGDKARIEQILSNLVVNAIKYTDTGNIWVRAYKVNATHWGIEVKDTGIGIAPEHLDHVFEPFRQTDESSSRQYGGVGLGLAIVQQLVAAMNGTVEVKSKFGQGSRFTVALPIQSAE